MDAMEGWGGIVKWNNSKEGPRSLIFFYAYTSGKFSTTQSTIDAEIKACINTLEKQKIYYLDKPEVTLRIDCQAIISFYNKANSNKSSRERWIKFSDAVTGTSVKINIEHIEGRHNTLADSLSRLTTTGLTKRKTFEFKTKKPEEFSSNWKPLHNDWAATTSKPKEAKDYFLEDDECNDDSIFIVDPGWDDYCLKALKLNHPEIKDARRACM
ncbi:putative polyprotein [Tanacetum coccineum]